MLDYTFNKTQMSIGWLEFCLKHANAKGREIHFSVVKIMQCTYIAQNKLVHIQRQPISQKWFYDITIQCSLLLLICEATVTNV